MTLEDRRAVPEGPRPQGERRVRAARPLPEGRQPRAARRQLVAWLCTGGTTATGGNSQTGGATATGGSSSTGGATATGGSSSTGGVTDTGGSSSETGATHRRICSFGRHFRSRWKHLDRRCHGHDRRHVTIGGRFRVRGQDRIRRDWRDRWKRCRRRGRLDRTHWRGGHYPGGVSRPYCRELRDMQVGVAGCWG